MSGKWPSTTGIYSNNANFNSRLPNTISMPQYLRKHGYYTIGTGKLFHSSSRYPKECFDLYSPTFPNPWPKEALLSTHQKPIYHWKTQGKQIDFPRNGMPADRVWQTNHTFDWGPVDIPDEDFRDAAAVNWSIEQLANTPIAEPFFMGVGFHLPHQPLYAPKRFHDQYPLSEVKLPPTTPDDLDDLSQAGRDYALIPTTSGTHASVAKHQQWKNAVSSYLATVTFVDHLVGNLLKQIDEGPYAQNTWIILFSDHGWHLGEKEHWGKATGWYRATRVPLILVPPKVKPPAGFRPGSRCDQPVNLIDLYTTINAICGLPKKNDLEGRNLLPLIQDIHAPWPKHTVTTFGRGNHAITTPRWRLIQYFDGTAELYDRQADPNEWKNLIDDPERTLIVARLRTHLPLEPQWKHFVRYKQFKAVIPADGSAMLLFNHAVENHLEERYDESEKHPEVVAHLANWLAEHPGSKKRVIVP
jgi:arylsulfatase A-like enzyme